MVWGTKPPLLDVLIWLVMEHLSLLMMCLLLAIKSEVNKMALTARVPVKVSVVWVSFSNINNQTGKTHTRENLIYLHDWKQRDIFHMLYIYMYI